MGTIILNVPASLRSATRPPALTRTQKFLARLDGWVVTVAALAIAISVTVCIIAYHAHTLLLYSDAYSHMIIARRVIDNATPGLAQLGGVWLPLPHIIMLPFIWNMFLWSSGLGGAIPSMACYVISAIYIFMAARRLTKQNIASFLGTLIFLLNPNVLYVQSTPLTEPVLIATMTMASYYFLAWAQDDDQNYLVAAAVCTFFASLARYDGWPLFLAILVLIGIIGWRKHQSIKQISGNLFLYGILGGFGIVLWFLWNLVIFGNPLYFLNGPYSSQIMQAPLIKAGVVETYHNLGQAIRYYTVISAETLGPVIFILAVVAVIVFVARRRLSPEVIASLVFLVPFVFYIMSLYGGQAVEYAPHAVPAHVSTLFYNDRYGTQMAAPAAIFLATLIAQLHGLGRLALMATVLLQTVLVATGGIITLQDGLYGASCSPQRATTLFLAQHYDNGSILEDTYFQNPQDFAFTVGIDLKQIVYQGSGDLWNHSLSYPATTVHWIYARTGDLVTRQIDVNSVDFLSSYAPVAHDNDGAILYHLKDAKLAQHVVSSADLTLHNACVKNNDSTATVKTSTSALLAQHSMKEAA